MLKSNKEDGEEVSVSCVFRLLTPLWHLSEEVSEVLYILSINVTLLWHVGVSKNTSRYATLITILVLFLYTV